MKYNFPLIVFFVSVLGLAGCSKAIFHDVVTNEYETYSDASLNGAFESGWLPRALPPSARKIAEVHSVDSNEMWIRFSYSGEDLDQLLSGCVSQRTPELPDANRSHSNVPWWPAELVAADSMRSLGRWAFFQCPKMLHASSFIAAGVAVERSSHSVWYWVTKN